MYDESLFQIQMLLGWIELRYCNPLTTPGVLKTGAFFALLHTATLWWR